MGMRFGPTRVPSYQSSFARKPTPLNDIPGLAAPRPQANAAGGDMSEVAQMIGPPQMAGSPGIGVPGVDQAMAGRNVAANQQKSRDAQQAADFAAGAPAGFTAPGLPKNDSDSAYGSAAQSAAARNAYINAQRSKANMSSGNYFQNNQFATDANNRQNAESGARVDMSGAETNAIDTDTRLMAPARARVLTAQGAAITGENDRANSAQPHLNNRIDSETDQTDTKTAQMKEALKQAGIYGPQMSMAKLAQQGAETDRYKQKTPAVIAGAGEAAANTAHLNKLNQQTLENERRLATQKIQALEAPQPQVDPEAAKVDTMKKKIDLYKSAGREDLIEGLLGPKPASSFNSMGQFAYELKKQAFDAKAKAEQGQAVGGGSPSGSGPNGQITQADLEHTAKMMGMTVEQVKAELAKRGGQR